MKAPWEFSSTPAPGRGVPNVPTPQGRLLGEQMARLADVEEAAWRAAHPERPPPLRCDDCAFRLGTAPNGCPGTLMDAVKCALEGEPFFCHKGVTDDTAPKRLCAGWVVLTAAGRSA